jgi:hypothetical protein
MVCASSAICEKNSGWQVECVMKCQNGTHLMAAGMQDAARAAGEQGINLLLWKACGQQVCAGVA